MSFLKKLNNPQESEIERDGDYLGGGGTIPSGIYDATVKVAFLKESKGGAKGVEVHFELEGGRTHRETFWVVGKSGNEYYVDKRTNKKRYLPGYTTVDDICLVTTETYLRDQDTEEKILELYDFETKKEVPTEVEVLSDLTGQEIKIALSEYQEYKQVWDDTKNAYINSDEIVKRNEVNKVFRTDGFTVSELMSEAEEPEFISQWDEKYSGELVDKTKGKKPETTGSGNSSKGGTTKPKSSLFKKG